MTRFFLGLVLLLHAAGASAHGRFPAAGQILFHPEGTAIFLRTTFGALISRDEGATWAWVCPTTLRLLPTEDPTYAFMSDGSLLAALFSGLLRSTDLGCNWEFPSGDLEGTVVIDLDMHPTDPASAFVVTSSGSAANGVHRTVDDGETWEPISPAFEAVLFEKLRLAPGNPDVLYLSGAIPPTESTSRQAFVFRSDDAGASWDMHGFDLELLDQNVYLMAVSPSDINRVFMRVRTTTEDRLVRSVDGGQSWTELTRMAFLEGLVIEEDAETLWIGGAEGILRSDDWGDTFESVSEMPVLCLAFEADALWVCGDTRVGETPLLRSIDEGLHFESVMEWSQVTGLLPCEADAEVVEQCAGGLPELWRDLGRGDAGPGDGGLDGSTDARSEMGGSGGGGCAIGSPVSGSGGWAVFVALLFCVYGRARSCVGTSSSAIVRAWRSSRRRRRASPPSLSEARRT